MAIITKGNTKSFNRVETVSNTDAAINAFIQSLEADQFINYDIIDIHYRDGQASVHYKWVEIDTEPIIPMDEV